MRRRWHDGGWKTRSNQHAAEAQGHCLPHGYCYSCALRRSFSKHSRLRTVLISGVLSLLVALSAASRPLPALNIDGLTAQADVIVVGLLHSAQEIGRTRVEDGTAKVAAKIMSGRIEIDRTIKGAGGAFLGNINYIPHVPCN